MNAAMGDVRSWLHHRWFTYFAGALAGLIIASSTSFAWQRTYNQVAITLLGTGQGLSALVSTESGRLLIVGGDDPIALANALSDAQPPTMRRIDVMVITPGASPLVVERAVAHATPARIMAIDARTEQPDVPRIDDPVRRIGAPRTIDLGGELLIDIDPGLIDGQPGTGWSIRVQSDSASVLLSESVPFRPAHHVGLVVIMGEQIPAAVQSLSIPVAIAADARDRPIGTFGQIEPGASRRIPINPDSIAVPVSWSREADA